MTKQPTAFNKIIIIDPLDNPNIPQEDIYKIMDKVVFYCTPKITEVSAAAKAARSQNL